MDAAAAAAEAAAAKADQPSSAHNTVSYNPNPTPNPNPNHNHNLNPTPNPYPNPNPIPNQAAAIVTRLTRESQRAACKNPLTSECGKVRVKDYPNPILSRTRTLSPTPT